jgi:iron complex outermembrane recepter protein
MEPTKTVRGWRSSIPPNRSWYALLNLNAMLVMGISSVVWAGDVVVPQLLSSVAFEKPATRPLQDHVLVEFTVTADGRVANIGVIESAGEPWDLAVRQALEQFTFRAAQHDGSAVAVRSRLSFATQTSQPENALDASSLDSNDAGDNPLLSLDAGRSLDEPDAGSNHPDHLLSTTVIGRSISKSRGPSDFSVEVGELAVVPRKNAAEFLKLAPGIFLANEGGEGHPDQIFLRGFDAEEGQNLELSVDGVPVNELGNLHGNGFADLNFLIPELISNVRVIEGPFDPRQGNFSVAGSAEYELGLSSRGLAVKAGYGSFNTWRLVSTWGPTGESQRTFGAIQLSSTEGFGQNRAASTGKFALQYEGELSKTTSFRLGASGYLGNFQTAGLLRADDVSEGLLNFFASPDARQGGNSSRAQVHLDIHGHGEALSFNNTVFGVFRNSRLKENFTGFILDSARGDLLDRDSTNVSIGSRGLARYRTRLLERNQELEVGYFGRFDVVRGLQFRIDTDNTPYIRDVDIDSQIADLGVYADVNVSPVWWLNLRGGLRVEMVSLSVRNNCVKNSNPLNPQVETACAFVDDRGLSRSPAEQKNAHGLALMPRGSLLLGPFRNVTFSVSAGTGVRSAEADLANDGRNLPFAKIFSYEAGAAFVQKIGTVDANLRAVVFGNRLNGELLFDETLGRPVSGPSTSRVGALLAGRGRGTFFDLSGNLTWVKGTFDEGGSVVPYVPALLLRIDGAIFGELPRWKPLQSHLHAKAGLGLSYVGARALPDTQEKSVPFTVLDVSAEVSWRQFTFGLAVGNLFDLRYNLGEYNFASDFRVPGSTSSSADARHFSAGAPRSAMLTFGINLGSQN